MDPGRDHPAPRAPRRLGRGHQHPPPPADNVDRIDHAVSGQVEKRARSITLRDRRLAHGSWSLSWWMSSQHPSQPKATSPSLPGPASHLHVQPRRASQLGVLCHPVIIAMVRSSKRFASLGRSEIVDAAHQAGRKPRRVVDVEGGGMRRVVDVEGGGMRLKRSYGIRMHVMDVPSATIPLLGPIAASRPLTPISSVSVRHPERGQS